MTALPLSASSIRPYLIDGCGYAADLVQDDFQYGDNQSVSLAAFSHLPLDARSACIAAIDCKTNDPRHEILQQRELGAPVIFASFHNRLQLWKPGPDGAECLEGDMTAGQLSGFFAEHEADLAPGRIYEAKTLGRIPGSGRQPDQFVDARLLPFAERITGSSLTAAVGDAVEILKQAFGSSPVDTKKEEWVLKSAFRLLAAKILKDKRVNGFISLNLRNIDDVFDRVQKHYGSTEAVGLGGPRQWDALAKAAEVFSEFSNLRHLTTEALADVYEETLVTKVTRKLRGTHGTPSYLVDYIVWQLADRIAKMDPSDLYVFEPACGHAPFLVGMIRLLRSLGLGMNPKEMSAFLRKRLSGIEVDQFALEIARLSLTVADVPHPNGWEELKRGDMFAGKKLEEESERSRVLLMNPPFEGTKPLRMLQRTIPHLPPGAVFGVIVPAGLLSSPKNQAPDLRKWLTQNCQLSEISLFPDGVFRFADQEIALIIGRRHFGRAFGSLTTRLRRVREEDGEEFKEAFTVTTDRRVTQAQIAAQDRSGLWVPELEDEVWCWLRDNPRLASIANLGKGLEHKSRDHLPPGTMTLHDEDFPGAVLGFTGTRGKPWIHGAPTQIGYLNLDPATIGRPRSGADTGKPQVLINYAPANRMIWKIRAFIDREGRPFTSRLLTVRPKAESWSLEYLWALCNSPIANAYVHTHCLKRDILVGRMREMPIPPAGPRDIRRITRLASDYIGAAGRFQASSEAGNARSLPLFDGSSSEVVDEHTLHSLLRVLDAEVLRLYGLPARAEKKLLDLFAGRVRPGVPGRFRGYYPNGFGQVIPLYAYLSDAFQNAANDDSPEIPSDRLDRYDELIDKQLSGELSESEDDELHWLQAEIAGRDYATQVPETTWLESIEEAQHEAQLSLGEIADDLIDLSRNGLPSHENPAT